MALISLTIVGSQVIYVNPAFVVQVRQAPDTEWCCVTLQNGTDLLVRDDADRVAYILNRETQ